MIISYSKKFIFCHCRKTAGSSVTCYLNHFLGPRDIQIGAWENTLQAGGSFNARFYFDLIHPNCLLHYKKVKQLLRAKSSGENIIGILNEIHKKRYSFFVNPPHPTAEEVKSYDNSAWNNYFKFCFIRNPFEKEVSDYIWRKSNRKKCAISFSQFLQRKALQLPDPEGIVPYPPTNRPIFTIDGKVAVDYIGRYENIEEDLKEICNRISIPFHKDKLPSAKKIKDYNYRKYYTAEDKKLLESLYTYELNRFSYSF